MSLLLLISLVLFALILAYIYLKWHYVRSANDPPGAEPHIFFGNLINSGLLTGKLTFHEVMIDYQRRFGDKFLFWFGSHPCPVFCLPEHAQTIFADRHTFEQSPLFLPNFDLLCPHGLITLTGAKWKRHVRVMLPMFKRAKVIHYLETIVECTDRFIDQHFNNDQVHTDLITHCQSLTMNIIGFIGFDYNLDSNIDLSLKKAFQNFIYHATLSIMFPWIPRWLMKIYWKLNWKYQRARRLIHELTEKIVEQEQNHQDMMENQRPKNLIASLVLSLNDQANDEQTSSGLTRAEMFDEVLVAIVAAYDTTSAALSWFIFHMSKNLHVQQRIRNELREHNLLTINDVDYLPSLTQDKLDSLIYCDCVAKEVLRLAPIAGVTTRIALRDTILDNVPIRQGQTLIIAMHNIHTDARYWHHADPTKFAPERFLTEDKIHHPYAMIPFGGGHRACIGQDLARLELKLIIVRLMQRGVTFEDTPENTGGYEDRLTCLPKKMAVRVRIDRH